jgi:hypothetical protein
MIAWQEKVSHSHSESATLFFKAVRINLMNEGIEPRAEERWATVSKKVIMNL